MSQIVLSLVSVLLGVLVVMPSLATAARTTPGPVLMECYDCQPEEEHCGDDAINLDKMRLCVGRRCFKSKSMKDGSESVVRGCWQVEMEDACTKEILAGADYYTCHCTGDKCNTAAAPVIALPLLVGMTSALYFA